MSQEPPNDQAMERIVLGAMMMSPDAVDDVVRIITADTFYLGQHAMVFRAIVAAREAGDPTEPTAVADRLHKAGELSRVGGAPFLFDLIQSVPTAANAGWYAGRLADLQVARGLDELAVKTRHLARGLALDEPATAVAQVQERLDALMLRPDSDDPVVWEELGVPGFDAIDEASKHTDVPTGVPTGLADLDRLLGGLKTGLIIVAGRTSMGKALSLDTPLPTPTGWTTMGEVQAGDYLIGSDGKPTRVVAATGVMFGRPCYEVEFSDGTVIVADAQHQWLTDTRASRRFPGVPAAVRTTEEIAGSLHANERNRYRNHSVRLAEPLQAPDADLPIDPYVLGVWLGDGDSASGRITSADSEIVANIELTGLQVVKHEAKYRYGVRGLTTLLQRAGLIGNKHIPAAYLRASESQRRALLAGLLDTDGSVANHGNSVRFEVTHRVLAEGAHELVLSLGYRCAMTTKRVPGKTEESSTCYRLTFAPYEKVFQLTRKATAQTLRTRDLRATARYIADVRPIQSVPVRCVEVDSPDHLYLASRSWIPTHNSTAARGFLRWASFRHKLPSVLFTNEMTRQEVFQEILSAECRIPNHVIKAGKMTDAEWTRAARFVADTTDVPFYIDDTPSLGLPEIRAKARRLHKRHPLSLVVVDYLQLLQTGETRGETRERAIAGLSRGLKILSHELDCPVVAVSQLNRGPEMRADKKPTMADLRESGAIENDANVIILVHREDYYDKESPRAGEADFIVAKHRGGPTDTITCAAQLHLSRFADMSLAEPAS